MEVLPAIDFSLNGTWADSYKVGDTLTIFDMSLYNSVTQEVLVEKMNYTVKYYGADITVNEDKFVITGGGRYVIEYSATYGDIEYKRTVEIMVDRADPAAGEVESFGDASIVDHITMSYASAPEYVTDPTQGPADAIHGFVKFAIEQQDSDTWPSLMFTPRLEKSAYDEYDYIAMTVKVVGTVESVVFNFYPDNQEKQTVTVGEWVTIKLGADMFCKFGYDSAKAGLFWFGNWGGKDIQEFYIYEIKAIYDDEVPTEVGALVVFDSEDKLENISTLETSEIVFYDADKIAAAGGSVPALDGNDTGYVAINNVASNEWFNIKITPECNYAEFSQYDLIQIKLYISGGEGTVPIYYFNNKMKELPRGEWITFNMPVEIYKETLHVNKKLYTARQMFNQLSIDAFIMLVKPEAYTVYISSITLAM